MSVISALILVVALAVSWGSIQNRTGIPDRVHSSIQVSVKQLIESYVKNNLTDLKEFNFEKIWSETINHKKIKVYFTYNYTENDAITSTRSGHIILHEEQDSSQPGGKLWAQKELKILDQVITFNKPLFIFSEGNDEN